MGRAVGGARFLTDSGGLALLYGCMTLLLAEGLLRSLRGKTEDSHERAMLHFERPDDRQDVDSGHEPCRDVIVATEEHLGGA